MAKKRHSSSSTPVRESIKPRATNLSDAPVQPKVRHRYVRPKNFYQQPWFVIGSILAVVLVVIVIFIYVANNQKIVATIGDTDPVVLKKVTSVKAQVFSDVNTGNVQNVLTPTTSNPLLKGPNAKPEFFYYGAEFCPLCAAERWPVVVALSRFGSFSRLPETASSSTDSSPNTATFTFVDSKYTSTYIDFVSVEAENRDRSQMVQTPTTEQQQLLNKYKVSGYPFIDVGDQFTFNTPQYSPDILKDLSQKDIANKLSNSNDPVTQNIIGSANYLTAAICIITQNQPANVCTSDPIPTTIQGLIPQALTSGSHTLTALDVLPEVVLRRNAAHRFSAALI